MAWVNGAPNFSVQLPFSLPTLLIQCISKLPIIALLTADSLAILDSATLLPLAVHQRLPQCLESHGKAIDMRTRQITADTSSLSRLHSCNVFLRTESHHVLVYHVLVNYNRSVYDVYDAVGNGKLLQNLLPMSEDSRKNALSKMLRTATRSLIKGGQGPNLVNVEHFNSCESDDEMRNVGIPQVKLSLVKILKTNLPIVNYWCKPNSQNLIIYSESHDLQVFNMKTFQSHAIALSTKDWFSEPALVEYNPNHNWFLFLSKSGEVGLIAFMKQKDETLDVKYSFLEELKGDILHFLFNPQIDLAAVQLAAELQLFQIVFFGKEWSFSFVKSIESPENLTYRWSPCGSFLTATVPNSSWRLISKLGITYFDSQAIRQDIVQEHDLDQIAPLCQISGCEVAPSAMAIYLFDKTSISKVQILRSLLQFAGTPSFLDGCYFNVLNFKESALEKYPILPKFQRIIANMERLNGVSLQLVTKRQSGHLRFSMNKYSQLLISFGNDIAVSTPVTSGGKPFHSLWYNFFNHFVEKFNIVDHFWVDSLLMIINRIGDEESEDGQLIDELILLNTEDSKLGAQGIDYKFDSDAIIWRHSFKNRILAYELTELHNSSEMLLVFVGSDSKILVLAIDFNSITKIVNRNSTASRLSIRVKKTIYLSSIRRKLAVQQIASVDNKHFLFLLSSGELVLLRNQENHEGDTHDSNSSNMYDLIKIHSSVEGFQICELTFEEKGQHFITLFTENSTLAFDLEQLIAHASQFNDPEDGNETTRQQHLKPIVIPSPSFVPLEIVQTKESIALAGLGYRTLIKHQSPIIQTLPLKQLVLNKFIEHDLLEIKFPADIIVKKYTSFNNFSYCLELLLFDHLEDKDDSNFKSVCNLVDHTPFANSVNVNFLRKIEVVHWSKFFKVKEQTPVEFMNTLIDSQDVDICYNFLTVYLNFKKEREDFSGAVNPETILNQKDKKIILEIIRMLVESEKWEQSYELCRFIKLLEPTGETLRSIRSVLV